MSRMLKYKDFKNLTQENCEVSNSNIVAGKPREEGLDRRNFFCLRKAVAAAGGSLGGKSYNDD